MSKRLLALMVMLLVFAGGNALADHTDPNGETNAQRCDTWYRSGHESGSPPSSHHHTDPADVNVNDPVNQTYIHQHGGHYVVRGKYGYLEVVGGQNYSRPFGDPVGARGGWVQGEIDPAAGAPDIDFHAGTFAGSDPGPWLGYAEANACASVLNTPLAYWTCKNPPKPGGTCN